MFFKFYTASKLDKRKTFSIIAVPQKTIDNFNGRAISNHPKLFYYISRN